MLELQVVLDSDSFGVTCHIPGLRTPYEPLVHKEMVHPNKKVLKQKGYTRCKMERAVKIFLAKKGTEAEEETAGVTS